MFYEFKHMGSPDYLKIERGTTFSFPNQIHALDSTESEHILCIFSPQLVQAYATKVSDKLPQNNKFQPDQYLVNTLAGLESTSSSADKKGVLYSLCGQFDKNATYDKKQFENEKLLYKIFLFVETNFNNDCSLSALSKETGYDYAYLSRYFKRSTGLSFNSYVIHFRLSHACYLMENTTQMFLQCAYNSGFSSLRNFKRCFKEYLGITPTQYL